MVCKLEITDLGYARGVTIGKTFIGFDDPDATNEKLKEVFGQRTPAHDYWALKACVDEEVAKQNRTNDKVVAEIVEVLAKHGLHFGVPMA